MPTNGSTYFDGSQFSLFAPWSPVSTWAFGIVVIGAITLFFAFLPGFIAVVKTKNTAELSWVMWLVSVIGLAFLVLFYLLGVISTAQGNDGIPAPHFMIVFICEALSLILSIYVFAYKLINMGAAKKAGISEAEYCARLVK